MSAKLAFQDLSQSAPWLLYLKNHQKQRRSQKSGFLYVGHKEAKVVVCLQLLHLKPRSGRIYDDRTQCRDFGEEYLKLPCSSGSPLRQARVFFFFPQVLCGKNSLLCRPEEASNCLGFSARRFFSNSGCLTICTTKLKLVAVDQITPKVQDTHKNTERLCLRL